MPLKGMGRTWQSFGKICLPCGRNLSSGDIAKCDPKFSGWKKTLRNRKTSKMPKCLGGAGRFWKTRAKQGITAVSVSTCQRNVTNLKHDQFESIVEIF